MASVQPNKRAGNARPGATAPPSTTAPGKSYQDPALAIHREDVLLQRFYVGANARPPNPVPPPPAETVYNRGTAQYEMPAYHNNGLPRPCRAGSGAPSYSTRRRPRPQGCAVPPPVAGAHTAVAEPAREYVAAKKLGRSLGGLPAGIEMNGGTPSVTWTTPPSEVDAARWLTQNLTLTVTLTLNRTRAPTPTLTVMYARRR